MSFSKLRSCSGLVASVVLFALLAGCSGSSASQNDACIYSNDDEAKQCKEGQIGFFRPHSWGNEQLPLNAAAVYCNFNHPVVHNDGGVVCVFTRKRMHLLE